MLSGVAASTGVGSFEDNAVQSAIGEIIAAGPNLQIFVGNLGGPGVANGTGAQARFDDPSAIALFNGTVYVADRHANIIRQVTSDGIVTTLAGTPYVAGSADGIGADARFSSIGAISTDVQGNIYVTDRGNNTVRKVTPAGVVTTLAGIPGTAGSTDGVGRTATFNSPVGIATDAAGNVYVADGGNNSIRKIAPGGTVSTVASVPNIIFVAVDQSGDLYASSGYAIYKVATTGTVSLIAGGSSGKAPADGNGQEASFANILGFALGPDGNLYAVDGTDLNQYSGAEIAIIRKVTLSGAVTTVIGVSSGLNYSFLSYSFAGFAIDDSGNFFFGDNLLSTLDQISPSGEIRVLAGSPLTIGKSDGSGTAATFEDVVAMIADTQGNIYAVDANAIRKITSAGVVTTIAGSQFASGNSDGLGSVASFNQPSGIAVDASGNLFVADSHNCAIRKVSQSGVVSTYAGGKDKCGHVDGPANTAEFGFLTGIAFGPQGVMYVNDSGYIRKIDTSGNVTTLAGSGANQSPANGIGSAAGLSGFSGGIAVDASGNAYVSEPYLNDIRKISPAGAVSSFAGALSYGYLGETSGSADGIGTAASFSNPQGLATDAKGNVYVADADNNTVRKIAPDGTVSTIVGSAKISAVGFTSGALPGLLPGATLPPQAVVVSGSSLYIACVTGIAVVRNFP